MGGTGIIKFTHHLLKRIVFRFTFAHAFYELMRFSNKSLQREEMSQISQDEQVYTELCQSWLFIPYNRQQQWSGTLTGWWNSHEESQNNRWQESVIGSPNQKEWRCVILQASRWQNMEKTASWSALRNPYHCVSLVNERYNYLEGEGVFNLFEWYFAHWKS